MKPETAEFAAFIAFLIRSGIEIKRIVEICDKPYYWIREFEAWCAERLMVDENGEIVVLPLEE